MILGRNKDPEYWTAFVSYPQRSIEYTQTFEEVATLWTESKEFAPPAPSCSAAFIID